MEYISEQPITKDGKLLSAIRFQKIYPDQLNKLIDGYKKNVKHLCVLSLSKDGIASVLCDSVNDEDKTIFAAFFCKSFTLTEFFGDILDRALKMREDNF